MVFFYDFVTKNDFINSNYNNTLKIIEEYQAIYIKKEVPEDVFSNYFVDFLSEISRKTKNLVLIIPPRTPHNNHLAKLKKRIASFNYIIWDFSDPEKYPEFYTTDYSFDLYHLNGLGADAYTKLLAQKYKELIK